MRGRFLLSTRLGDLLLGHIKTPPAERTPVLVYLKRLERVPHNLGM